MGILGNQLVSCKPTCTCTLSRAFQQLALPSAALQLYFTLNTNATALLGSMLWAVHTLAAAFLRRSSKGFDTDFKRPTHCAYFYQTRPLAINSEPSHFGEWASGTQQQRTGTIAPQNDLERVFTFMMDEIVFCFVIFVTVFERGKFGGYTMEMWQENCRALHLFALLFILLASFRNDETNDDGFFPTRRGYKCALSVEIEWGK